MALDPRLLTPAALMNRSTAPARAGFVRPGVNREGVVSVYQDGRGMNVPRAQISRPSGPQGLEALSQQQFMTEALGGDLLADSPMSVKQSFAQSMGLPDTLFETTPKDDQQAKTLASDVVGGDVLRLIEDGDASDIESMATDNSDDVTEPAKKTYENNPELAKLLGALVKIQNSTQSSELFEQLLKEKTTPEKAREEVNKFFKIDQSKETPVWADVAVSVGLSLLRGEGKKQPGDSELSSFLKDVGVAGERGFAVAKQRRKEKSARSDMLNKLAFGVFREDEKQRKTLGVQLAKQLGEERKAQSKLVMDLATFYQNQEKIDGTEARGRATAISNSLNILTKDQKEKALPIIARHPNAFSGVSADNIPATMFALLKANGLKLEDVADASNIVESNFVISTKEEFDFYKNAFPSQFGGLEFKEGKIYTVEGFTDKSKVGEDNRGLINILGVKPSIGDQPSDELQRQFAARTDLLAAMQGMSSEDKGYAELNSQLTSVNNRISLLTERKPAQQYVFADGQMVAAGPDAAGAFAASDAVQKANNLSNQGNALGSAFGLADGIMVSLSKGEAPSDVTGVVSKFGLGIRGVSGQITAITGNFGNRASDNQASYLNGTITDVMKGSTEKVGNTTVGKVFTRLSELADGNVTIQSQLMSFAYALAGSRETGKLTDKDVAAALVTFGGGDISEGKWFASGETLIAGINQALTTATNDYAIRYNKVHQAPGNLKYLKEVEGLTGDDLTDRTTFDVNRFLRDNEGIRSGLSDRIIYDPTGANGQLIRMQSLDKYRGDGAGNVDTGNVDSKFTPAQLELFNTLGVLEKLFENDRAGLASAVEKFSDADLEAYREYKAGR